MDGLFTPLTESFADNFAPKIANVSVAAGVYFWLFSRAFAQKNSIGISINKLADYLQKDRRTVQKAVKRLAEEGLITHDTYKHDGGGSTFHIVGLDDAAFLSHLKKRSCDEKFAAGAADGLQFEAKKPQRICKKRHATKKGNFRNGDQKHSNSPYDH